MRDKVPWKTGMLIYLPVTSQPAHILAERSGFVSLHLGCAMLSLLFIKTGFFLGLDPQNRLNLPELPEVA